MPTGTWASCPAGSPSPPHHPPASHSRVVRPLVLHPCLPGTQGPCSEIQRYACTRMALVNGNARYSSSQTEVRPCPLTELQDRSNPVFPWTVNRHSLLKTMSPARRLSGTQRVSLRRTWHAPAPPGQGLPGQRPRSRCCCECGHSCCP